MYSNKEIAEHKEIIIREIQYETNRKGLVLVPSLMRRLEDLYGISPHVTFAVMKSQRLIHPDVSWEDFRKRNGL